MCSNVHKAYFLKLLIREIRAALGTWKWKGKGNVLGSRAAAASTPPVRALNGAPPLPLSRAQAALAG